MASASSELGSMLWLPQVLSALTGSASEGNKPTSISWLLSAEIACSGITRTTASAKFAGRSVNSKTAYCFQVQGPLTALEVKHRKSSAIMACWGHDMSVSRNENHDSWASRMAPVMVSLG